MVKNKKNTISNEDNIVIKNNHHKKEVYYSFLTIVLLLCFLQVGFSAILNITRLFADSAKIMKFDKALDDAQNHNQKLKEEINTFSATKNLEGIARNSLKMAAPNEVLIIINNEQNKEVPKNIKKIEDKNAK